MGIEPTNLHEHWTTSPRVVGSNPYLGLRFFSESTFLHTFKIVVVVVSSLIKDLIYLLFIYNWNEGDGFACNGKQTKDK